jgi:DNA-binding PucR family transcriptional regulator
MLVGDEDARRTLLSEVYGPLLGVGGHLLETLGAYLSEGRSLEATARLLFVHPNTVRYRLRRIATITGWDPTDAREGFVLQIALAAGRLESAAAS